MAEKKSKLVDAPDAMIHSAIENRKKKKDKKRRRQNEDEETSSETKVAESTLSEIDTNEVKHVVNEKEDADNGKRGDDTKTDEKESRRRAKKEQRLAKKKEKEDLMEKVPKVDEIGIAYTKLQTKRMLKRVKQGLAPVPTEQEERDRLRREAELRREEEAELAGMIYKKEDRDDENEPPEDDSEKDDEGEGDEDADMEEDPSNEGTSGNDDHEVSTGDDHQPPKKKSKRAKPVPPDYVCQACKNQNSPPHWIYDCPDKKTVKGTNHKKKKERGVNQPDSRKVFVSGLPFDVKPADVQQLFQKCGKVASCKLVKFGDTGRCNGQAYVAFDSDEAATNALKLSGTTIDNAKEEKKVKSKKAEVSSPKRQELKLKISRVLNRRLTKISKKPKPRA